MIDIHNKDEKLTRRALELAARGVGLVSPNPLVGCVIVSADGQIVGEGTYVYDNVTHAEVLALEIAGERAHGGTAYVSLEPHAHHGKTPPCTQALLDAGIKRVVSPIEDPNPLVSGRGFERLRSAGVEVVTGILADEAARQNEKFICWHKKGRPFVHLKLAMSLDGRISVSGDSSTRLSGEAATRRVHELRHEYDAILIGSNTAVVDDPSLTDRSAAPRRRPLVRIVLDSAFRLKSNSVLVSTANDVPTIVFTNSNDLDAVSAFRKAGVDFVNVDPRDLAAVLDLLKEREIQSVLVEGGSHAAGSFADAGLVDKVTFIYSPVIIGGEHAPVAVRGRGVADIENSSRLAGVTVTNLGEDVEITGYPR